MQHYTIQVICQNCSEGEEGTLPLLININHGEKIEAIAEMLCPNCLCKTLIRVMQ